MSEFEVPCLRELQVGRGSVTSVSWSPDGTRLAIGDESGAVEVLTAEGRSLWRQTEHEGDEVRSVVWSPDGWRLASLSASSIRDWNSETGQSRILLREILALGYSVAWSPQARQLAWTPGNKVVIAEAATGETSVTYGEHHSSTWSVDWSPEGHHLASGDGAGNVHIWDSQSGRFEAKFEGHGTRVRSVKWSPDGRRLACSGLGMRVWSVAERRCLMQYGDLEVQSVSWSPSGDLLAAGSNDGAATVWDSEAGLGLAQLPSHSKSVQVVAFSPDGLRLASAGDGVRIWDVHELVARQRGGTAGSALLLYAARQAATVGRRTSRVRQERWVPKLPEAEGACLGLLRGTDGDQLVAGCDLFPDGLTLTTSHTDGSVRRWDLRTGQLIWTGSDQHGDWVRDVRVSPQGTLIATGSDDSTLRIWEPESGGCIRILEGGSGSPCVGIAWSPAGDRLAGAMGDGNIIIWETSTGKQTMRCQGHGQLVWAVSWSPNGKFIASASKDKTLRIWDAQSGLLVHTIEAHSDWAKDVKWSPDGHRLASASSDSTVAIWDTQSWVVRLRYEGHQNVVQNLAWAPDGNLIASAGDEQVVRVWETESGQDLAEFPFEERDAWRVAWSPSGAFLVSSHFGDVFRFWDTRRLSGDPQESVMIPAAGPLSRELDLLTEAFAGLHRLGLYPPLSLLEDLLALTVGERGEEGLAILSVQPGIRALAGLRWPAAARVGLVALLLRGVPLEYWKPPGGVSFSEMIEALGQALHGETAEPDPPPVPISALQQATEVIDNRLVTLLTAVGPQAVAADPGLPLRLLPRLPAMPKLGAPQRRLLGIRLRSGTAGRSLGYGSGSERSGVELRGDLRSLLPSQLALPKEVLTSRHLRGELLYRARTGEESPRLRPAVLVLDVSPASFGPVEATTRLAAHVLASSLLQAGLPVVLVTAGGRSEVYSLERVSDLVEVWTRRSLEPAEAGRALGVARALRETLREGPLEPIIVLLAHAWFGAEEEVPAVAGLRGLFVQYPSHASRPSLASVCERWENVPAGEAADLAGRLARVVG